MQTLSSIQLRKLWKEFFTKRAHAVIPSASLIPENDPTVLFTTAGMHPLVPYLLGQEHPLGKRLCNVQKCVRTGDIDQVGDASHCTFFEMLGNWSLGDYFKDEMIKWSYEFLTECLKIDISRLAVTVFKGDADAPRDDYSAELWLKCGIKKENIYYLEKEHNWWGPAGITGPCGPDTEMFIDTLKPKCSKDCSPACSCGKFIEIWNDVFMEYFKNTDGSFSKLNQKNVDTGMGLERVLMTLNNKKSVYETDVFEPVIAKIETISGLRYSDGGETMRAMRIIADHIRTSVFMLGDHNAITPSNVDQGYVLRRLLRRAIRYSKLLNFNENGLCQIAEAVILVYKDEYNELQSSKERILEQIAQEQLRFENTLSNGIKEFEKLCFYQKGDTISGKAAFRLYDTFGFPIEMTCELANERGFKVDIDGFNAAFSEHQQKSQQGASERFKGGLADDGELTTNLHTATHLMHRALKVVLKDENVNQKGSNITKERLRFDFSFNRPLTDEEIKAVEDIVNEAISKDISVVCKQMTVDDAKKTGAVGLFESKYGEQVKVYIMGDYSCEICGGPHAPSTGALGRFKIVKEQSSSAGVRRIKAVLEGTSV